MAPVAAPQRRRDINPIPQSRGRDSTRQHHFFRTSAKAFPQQVDPTSSHAVDYVTTPPLGRDVATTPQVFEVGERLDYREPYLLRR